MAHIAASLSRLRDTNKELVAEIEGLKKQIDATPSDDEVELLRAEVTTLRHDNNELRAENERLHALSDGPQKITAESAESSYALIAHPGNLSDRASSQASEADSQHHQLAATPAPDPRLDIIAQILEQYDARLKQTEHESGDLRASLEGCLTKQKQFEHDLAATKKELIASGVQGLEESNERTKKLENAHNEKMKEITEKLAACKEHTRPALSHSHQSKDALPKIAELNRLAARMVPPFLDAPQSMKKADMIQEILKEFKDSTETRFRHDQIVDSATEKEQLYYLYKKLSANVSSSDDQLRRAGPFEVSLDYKDFCFTLGPSPETDNRQGTADEFRRLRQRVLLRLATADAVRMSTKAVDLVGCKK